MSAHGYEMAKKLGYQMGRCGLTVISGIAAGIDAASLEGALMADALVAAVLGCGADIVYPAANRRLYADVELEGCLLTEYPPGSRPEGWHFRPAIGFWPAFRSVSWLWKQALPAVL